MAGYLVIHTWHLPFSPARWVGADLSLRAPRDSAWALQAANEAAVRLRDRADVPLAASEDKTLYRDGTKAIAVSSLNAGSPVVLVQDEPLRVTRTTYAEVVQNLTPVRTK